MSQIATLLTFAFIAALFYWDREESGRTSKALWIPILWLLIVGSRPVSMWLNLHRDVTLSDRYTEGSPLDAAVFGILILAALLTLNNRADRIRSYLRANWPILLFFSYCAVSVIWSDEPVVSLKRVVKAIGDFAMVLVVLTDNHPSLAIRRVFASVGFVLLPLSLLFIFFYPSMGSSYNESDHVMMYFGVTTFKNLLGVTCMFSGLGALASFLRAWQEREMPFRTRHLIAHGIVIAMAFWLIKKADSMTSLSCFGLASVVMVGSTTRWARRSALGLFSLVGTTTIFAVFALFLDTTGMLVHSLGRNSTLTGRKTIWAAVLAQHINPVIGTGFESFWMGDRLQSVWSMSQVGIQEAHDGYLELYLNLGWAGIALLGLLIVAGYRNAVLLFRRDPQGGGLRLALFTAGLIYSLTEAGFRMMSLTWIAFLLAITAVPLMIPGVLQQPTEVPLRQTQDHDGMRILQ